MLTARIYVLLWLLLTAVAVNTFLNDSFSYGTTMILGFSASILAGAGLLVVYPALLTERVSSWRKTPK